MDFREFLALIVKILGKMPPLWVAVCFLVLTLLVVLAIKRIFF